VPDGRQPDEAKTGQRSLARCVARCLVLTGGAIAAWLLTSGVASAAESVTGLANESAPSVSASAQVPATTSEAVAGLFELAKPPAPEPLPPATEVPGELVGVIANPPAPPRLPGLDRLPPLAQLPPLDEPPFMDDEGERPPVEWRPVQRPEPHEPATTAAAPRARTALAVAAASAGHRADAASPLATSRPADTRHTHGDPVNTPELPAGDPRTDLPCPASPGQPAPTPAGGSACAVEPAGMTGGTAAGADLRPSAHGPATPRAIAEQPGTTPD
jgi:hypothetical protein